MRRCSSVTALILLLCSLPAFSQEKPSVAVLDLQTTSVSEKEMEAYISLLSSSIFRTGVYTVIDISTARAYWRKPSSPIRGAWTRPAR